MIPLNEHGTRTDEFDRDQWRSGDGGLVEIIGNVFPVDIGNVFPVEPERKVIRYRRDHRRCRRVTGLKHSGFEHSHFRGVWNQFTRFVKRYTRLPPGTGLDRVFRSSDAACKAPVSQTGLEIDCPG